MSKIVRLCGLLACVALSFAPPLRAAEPVRIGVLASSSKLWQPLASELKRQIPERDFVIETLDYGELEAAVASRNVDFVLTNPGNYLQILRRSGLSSPLATLVSDDDGHRMEAVGGVIICRAERTDIRELNDIRGKTVAYVDPGSMEGYQMQAYELTLKGVDPQDVRWLKTGLPYDLIVDAVLGGKADVGFVRAGLIESMVRGGKLDASRLRVLNRQDMPDYPWALSTHLYPGWAFAALPNPDASIARRITAVLLTLDRNPALLRALKINGFTVPADYQVVEEMLVKLKLPPFDEAPHFSLADVWKKYRGWIAGMLLLLGLVAVLIVRLAFNNRRLHSLRQSLAASEKHYRLLVEHMHDVVWVLDPSSLRFTYVSPSVFRLRGYTAEEVMGEPMDAALPPEAAAELKQRIAQRIALFESGKERDRVYVEELVQSRKEGPPVLTEVTSRYFRNEDTGQIEIHGVTRDMTERKLAENRLWESKKLLDTIVENIPNMIFLKRASDLRFELFNRAGESLLGYDRSALIGKNDYDFFPKEQADSFTAKDRDVLAQDEIVDIAEEPINTTRGVRVLHTRKLALRDAHGKPQYLLGISEDITERIAREKALREKTADLQCSNSDLERFAYSVSHDMRQPLRAISGHLQLLLHSLRDKLDEDERQNLNFALDGARRMDSMIVSLLDYSRVGRKTEEMKIMASRAALDEALDFLAPLIAETQTQVATSGVWPQVFASRDELTRLFQNLIGNAIKFREAGQPARVEVDSSVVGGIWHASVRDHGIGIDPKQIDRLFQFFSRLQPRTRFDGTGMGLALCRRIVEHHAGRIWIESEGEGKGSMAVFELPLGESEGKERSTQ